MLGAPFAREVIRLTLNAPFANVCKIVNVGEAHEVDAWIL